MSKADGSWINWFIHLPSSAFLCRVPYEYARDKFNLTGLEVMVDNFHDTLDAILESEFDSEYGFDGDTDADMLPGMAEQVYGLIHARYILTRRGITDMSVKYQRGDFGTCPRIYCNGQVVLPLGLTDRIGESHVKVYCPRCQDMYEPEERFAQLDGAMFGCSFPHMFFMQLPHLLPVPPIEKYTPRIYGFKVHEQALMPPTHALSESDSKEHLDQLAELEQLEQLEHFEHFGQYEQFEQAELMQGGNWASKRRYKFTLD